MTLAAVDRGLPVLVEKPLTLDVGEAEAVLDRVRSKGVPHYSIQVFSIAVS